MTTTIEPIGVPSSTNGLSFNGNKLDTSQDSCGALTGKLDCSILRVLLPSLKDASWRYIDSLPEIQPNYNDSAWTESDHTSTQNPRNLTINPTGLYGSNYSYNVGNLLFRGHFTAGGPKSALMIRTRGSTAFGVSYWVNGFFLGSLNGISVCSDYNQTVAIPKETDGQPCVLTVLVDNMGLDEENVVGSSTMKVP